MPMGTSHSTYGNADKKISTLSSIHSTPSEDKSEKTYLKRTCIILVHAVKVLGVT